MPIFSRYLLVTAAALLMTVGSVQAQGSDVGGAVPQSDISGSFVQSDLFFFQSDEARIRVNDIASALAQQFRDGSLGARLGSTGRSIAVTTQSADLFLAPSEERGREAMNRFQNELQIRGVQHRKARVLARSVTGLLEEGTLTPETFASALHAFNAVVNDAPTSFLAAPPEDFVLARIVLSTLLDGASS